MKEIDEELSSRVRDLATERIRESIGMGQEQDREGYLEQVQTDILSEILDNVETEEDGIEISKDAVSILGDIEKEEMRHSIVNQGKRVDGRGGHRCSRHFR